MARTGPRDALESRPFVPGPRASKKCPTAATYLPCELVVVLADRVLALSPALLARRTLAAALHPAGLLPVAVVFARCSAILCSLARTIEQETDGVNLRGPIYNTPDTTRLRPAFFAAFTLSVTAAQASSGDVGGRVV
jgi:hypothetical protein